MFYSMKRLFVVLMLGVLASSLFGQKLIKTRMDSIAYDLAYTKYNIGRFHKEWQTGLIVTYAGVAVSGLSIAFGRVEETTTGLVKVNGIYVNGDITTYNYTPMYVGMVVGGAISLVGQIISLDSYKWLKRASIKPTQYGVSFRFNIDEEYE
jgi:hypothetical protein